MKNLSRIISRYLLSAVLILLVTLLLNVFFYIVCGFQIIRMANRNISHIRLAAEELSQSDGEIVLSDTGRTYLQEHYVWAMLLDDAGSVIWDWNLPEHLRHVYTPSEIAAFSKWYLDDYPVTERVTDYGLLVAAEERDSIWKYNISNPIRMMEFILHMIPVTLLVNLGLLLFLVVFFGVRFYRSLRTLAGGIQSLSAQEEIRLPEKGMTELLARQLNRTSELLVRQREQLERRDDARASWIRGVSHDIRTPLSLIMGYASSLKEDPALPAEQRRLAGIIEGQSLQIKHLIEDLNLTSKLEYHMQPLRTAAYKPSRLLRTVVSDFYNRELSEACRIDLYIDPDVEQMTFTGDAPLLTRAFSNLIGNSIRHNPDGCTVTVTAYPYEGGICFQISDDGCGIPANVIQALEGTLSDTEKAPHIMGLRIAGQIFLAHGWNMVFTDQNTIHIFGGAAPPS